MMKLKDGKPYHEQISDWLRSQIEAEAIRSEEKLPSENTLSEKFDVSRVTVRRALQTLENEQLIYRCQGIGSFVSDRRTHRTFTRLQDFNEELDGSGMHPSTMLVSFEQVEADREIASFLNVKEGAIVTRLERVRRGDEQPVAFDITWLPIFYGQLLDGADLEHATLFQILEGKYDIPVLKGCYRLDAAVATTEIAAHLGIEKNTPLFLTKRMVYSIGDKLIYYQNRYYRTDKMVFEIRTERNTGQESQTDKNVVSGFITSQRVG